MARWALSTIVGDGTRGNPYRPKAADYTSDWMVVLPSNGDGSPKYNWCLVRFESALLASDPDIRLLPDVPLDHVITAAEATAILSACSHYNLTPPSPQGRTVAQVLRWLGDRLDITWDGIR